MTTEEAPPSTAPARRPEPALARLVGVFVAPSRTFAAIAQRPTWILPVAVAAGLALPLSELILSRMNWRAVMSARMAGSAHKLTDAQMDGIVERMRGLSWMWDVFAVLAPVLVTLVVAGALWAACQAFGWEVRFPQSLGITAHAFFPATLASAALLVVLWNRDTIDPETVGDLLHTNLGFLVDARSDRVLHGLLGSLDLFALWSMALMVLGLSAAARASRARVAALVASLWALFVLGKAGIAAFRG